MKNIFLNHPKSLGETYLQHGLFAWVFGIKLLVAGVACILHGIFPFIFQNTGSNMLLKTVHDWITRMPTVDSRIQNLVAAIEKKYE